jgi:hypothetical protein
MHSDFTKYQENEALHEAGFDSYQTARIMILLSAKLHANEEVPGTLSSPKKKSNKKPTSSSKSASGSVSVVMPSFENPFWIEYGNRLRVFGTTESFMELNPERETKLPILTTKGK